MTLTTAEPVRGDYAFLGWSTDQHALKPTYRPGDTYSEEADLTLYAVWQRGVLYACSLNLEGKIGINFYVDGAAYAKLNNGITSRRVDLTTYDEAAKAYRATYPDIAAAELDLPITITLFTENDQRLPLETQDGQRFDGDAYAYRASDWINSKIGSEQSGKIAQALETYGAYANAYFNDKPTSSLPDVSGVSIDEKYNIVYNGTVKHFAAMSLLLQGDTTLRLYFDQAVTVEDEHENSYRIQQNDNGYYIERTGIAAADLGTKYSFHVQTDDADYTITCCALSYANDRIRDGSGKIVPLCKALYQYNAAAKTYFGK